MRKTLMAACLAAPLMALSLVASAADPVVGRWKTIDSETGKPKSFVEITQAANGTISGRSAGTAATSSWATMAANTSAPSRPRWV